LLSIQDIVVSNFLLSFDHRMKVGVPEHQELQVLAGSGEVVVMFLTASLREVGTVIECVFRGGGVVDHVIESGKFCWLC
jgi:hypothetical protein